MLNVNRVSRLPTAVAACGLFVVALVFMAPADPEMSLPPAEMSFFRTMKRQPHGPSFDCTLSALTSVERRICKDPKLAALDLQLNDEYAAEVFYSYDVLGDVARQVAWLQERDRCTTKACLRETYTWRVAHLRNLERAHDARLANNVRLFYKNRKKLDSPSLTATLGKMAGKQCFRVDELLDVGDGRPSVLAHTCGSCMPEDHFLIFHPEHGTYRLLLRAPECYVSGIFTGFQDSRSHGLRRIETFSRAGGGDYIEEFYDYDGDVYRCVARVEQQGVGARASRSTHN